MNNQNNFNNNYNYFNQGMNNYQYNSYQNNKKKINRNIILVFIVAILIIGALLYSFTFGKSKSEIAKIRYLTLVEGDTIKLERTGYEADEELKYENSNNEVLNVNNEGEVTALKKGKATVTIVSKRTDGTQYEIEVKSESESIKVEEVKLSKEEVTLEVGESSTITYEIGPFNATNQNVSWYSTNEDVAVVENGKIVAKGSGEATIIVKSGNNITAETKVKIEDNGTNNNNNNNNNNNGNNNNNNNGNNNNNNNDVLVQSISLDKTTANISVGGTINLTAVINPTNATNKTLTWKSSNPKVASVDNNGKVTGIGKETATITATTSNNKTATCNVTVDSVQTASMNWSLELKSNGTQLLKVNDNNYIYYNYKNVMVDMYKVLYFIGKVYGITPSSTTSTNSSDYSKVLKKISELKFSEKISKSQYANETNIGYRYGSYTDDLNMIKINNNKKIVVPDIYYFVNSKKENIMTDDSVLLDIEAKNNHYYLPLYFFTNIPGIKVTLNGKNLYSNDNYINSYNAINTEQTTQTIVIDISKITNLKSLNKKLSSIDNYYGEENGALWREEALKRIEKNKKKELTVNVVDANGKKIDNATVNVSMTKNNFLFGTSVESKINNSTKTHSLVLSNPKISIDVINNNYFNALRPTSAFREENSGEYASYRVDIVNAIRNIANISYVRGHYIYWDHALNNYSLREKLVIEYNKNGDPKKNPDTSCTMYAIDQKYKSLIKEGKTAKEALQEVTPYIKTLKEKFYNVIIDYVKSVMSNSTLKTINEWDVFNELYTSTFFQRLLFTNDETGKPNFLNSKYNYLDTTYKENSFGFTESHPDEYMKLLSKVLKEIKNTYKYNGILTFNQLGTKDSVLTPGSDHLVANLKVRDGISLIKGIDEKYWSSSNYSRSVFDVLGLENGLEGQLFRTPQTISNETDYVLGRTKIPKAEVTEYTMSKTIVNSDGSTTYDGQSASTKTKKARAKYLKDTLIMVYSDPNFTGFLFRHYITNSRNSEEEMKTYRDFIEGKYFDEKMHLLKLNKSGKTSNGVYKTSLYNDSTYNVVVTVNGKKYTNSVVLNDNKSITITIK